MGGRCFALRYFASITVHCPDRKEHLRPNPGNLAACEDTPPGRRSETNLQDRGMDPRLRINMLLPGTTSARHCVISRATRKIRATAARSTGHANRKHNYTCNEAKKETRNTRSRTCDQQSGTEANQIKAYPDKANSAPRQGKRRRHQHL